MPGFVQHEPFSFSFGIQLPRSFSSYIFSLITPAIRFHPLFLILSYKNDTSYFFTNVITTYLHMTYLALSFRHESNPPYATNPITPNHPHPSCFASSTSPVTSANPYAYSMIATIAASSVPPPPPLAWHVSNRRLA